MDDRTLLLRRVRGSEVLPQAERYFGQHQARVANPAVGHVVVAGIVGDVAHPTTLRLSVDPVGFLGFNLRGSRGWYLLRANEGLLATPVAARVCASDLPRANEGLLLVHHSHPHCHIFPQKPFSSATERAG